MAGKTLNSNMRTTAFRTGPLMRTKRSAQNQDRDIEKSAVLIDGVSFRCSLA